MSFVISPHLLQQSEYHLLITIQYLVFLLLPHTDAQFVQLASNLFIRYITVFQLLMRAEGVVLGLNLTV